jgi:hypothetical protein
VKLVAGYSHIRRGAAGYRGVLRVTPKAVPSWTCRHEHLTTRMAAACAVAELERRENGEKEVFSLLNCTGCARWWTDPGARQPLPCPRCTVLLERVKVQVLEREKPGLTPAPPGI